MDRPIGDRISRWWTAYGAGGSVYLPLVMVGSGKEISSGSVNYATVYGALVDQELARPPAAEIAAFVQRVGDTLRVWATLTNHSTMTLSAAANQASVHALVWEDKKVGTTGRIVRAAPSLALASALAPGGTASFTLTTPALTGVDWSRLHTLVAADYRPQGRIGAYDMLQAAIAVPPVMDAQPSSLSLRAPSSDPAAGRATVRLCGPHVIRWQATTTNAWLDVTPEAGALPADVTVTLLPELMPTGSDTATVVFTGNSDDGLSLSCQLDVAAERLASRRPLRVRLHGGP